MKILIIALIVFMTVGITFSKTFLQSIGLETNYILLALGGLCVTGLVVYRGLALIVAVCLVAISVNLPNSFLLEYAVNQDILFALLIMMVIFPLVYRQVAR